MPRNVLDVIRSRQQENAWQAGEITKKGSKQAMKCRVGFKVNSLWDVDCRALTFRCDIKLFYQWQDLRLVGQKTEDVDWSDPKLFDPELMLGNASDIENYYYEKIIEKPAIGLVRVSTYYRGVFHLAEVCMKNFPFDYQDLAIVIRPHKMPASKVELEAWSECAAIDHVPRHEWNCVGLRTETYATNPKLSTTHKVYCVFHVIVMVERFSGWFMWNVTFVLFIIILASSVVFFLPFGTYDALGYRMETSVALILASVATKYVVSSELPKISYNTICDKYILYSYFFNTTVIACNLLTYLVNKITAMDPDDELGPCDERPEATCSFPCHMVEAAQPSVVEAGKPPVAPQCRPPLTMEYMGQEVSVPSFVVNMFFLVLYYFMVVFIHVRFARKLKRHDKHKKEWAALSMVDDEHEAKDTLLSRNGVLTGTQKMHKKLMHRLTQRRHGGGHAARHPDDEEHDHDIGDHHDGHSDKKRPKLAATTPLLMRSASAHAHTASSSRSQSPDNGLTDITGLTDTDIDRLRRPITPHSPGAESQASWVSRDTAGTGEYTDASGSQGTLTRPETAEREDEPGGGESKGGPLDAGSPAAARHPLVEGGGGPGVVGVTGVAGVAGVAGGVGPQQQQQQQQPASGTAGNAKIYCGTDAPPPLMTHNDSLESFGEGSPMAIGGQAPPPGAAAAANWHRPVTSPVGMGADPAEMGVPEGLRIRHPHQPPGVTLGVQTAGSRPLLVRTETPTATKLTREDYKLAYDSLSQSEQLLAEMPRETHTAWQAQTPIANQLARQHNHQGFSYRTAGF